MRAGFFETDITPAVGMEKPGGYGKAYGGARHDPLKVRAGVFGEGEDRVALVGIDTCVISARAVREARQAIQERSGILPDHVMIGASHTHSGGPLFGFHPDEVQDAPEPVRQLILEYSTITDPLYHDWAVNGIVTAVCEADRLAQQALYSIGCGQEDGAVFNRRQRMTNGRAYSHAGKGNPEIIDYAGPVDPDVGVLAAWDPDGGLLGCVVNYTCHGTTSPGGISADWIYYLEQTIRGVMGADAVVVLLNGACGDVTQVNNLKTDERESGEKYARMVGARVGAEAVKVLVTAEKADTAATAALSETLAVARRPPSADSLERSQAIVAQGLSGGTKTPEWTFAKERLVLDYIIDKEPVADVEVQAVQVGPAVFLANPAEYFCALGLNIKERSPFPFTFVVELANGGVGYVPTEEAFEATGGGYETVLTSYSNLAPDAGTRIADTSVELSQRLTPDAVPQRPQVEVSTTPWSYGRLGPELE